MANMNKRRFITQLPAVHQTDILKNFFAATIDNLFQPGASEAISGYVGQKPSYFDALKDFYVPESTPAREAYQLEPAMVSTNSASEMSHSLCYDDLINYLRSQGADVSNHNRLFDGEYYSWSPPVDLDKLNNPRQYVWMGGLTSEEDRRSALVLRAPRQVSGFAGDNTFPLPPANPDYQGKFEHPVVLVNGFPARASFTSSHATIIGTLVNGDRIETIRYGDLTLVLNGQKDADFSYLMGWDKQTSNVDSANVYRTNLKRTYLVGDMVWARQDVTTAYKAWRCAVEHEAGDDFEIDYWTAVLGAEKATSGVSVRLEDGIGTMAAHADDWEASKTYALGARIRHKGDYLVCVSAHTSEALFDAPKWQVVGSVARRFFVDGVGTKIELTADYTTHSGGRVPHHTVIDRRSREDSPWTQRNLWVHRQTLEWSGMLFTGRQATRPIIEFLPDIELFNYGSRRLGDVNSTLSTEMAKVRDNYDLYPYDVLPWQEEDVAVSRINGQPIGYLSYYNKDKNGKYVLQDGVTPGLYKERREPFGCVEVDAFKPTHLWSASAPFDPGARIIVGNAFYEAVSAHVSTASFLEDFNAGLWTRVDGYLLKPGDRLLVRQSSTTEPELNNLVYRVVANYDVNLTGGGEADVLELIAEAPPERGDIIRVLRNGNTSVFADTDEYWFDGERWLLAQESGSAPLFMLYDADQNRLNDDSIYLGTDFAGSRLFGFKVGTGKPDAVLGFPLENNQYAQPIFEVDPITRRTTFEGGEVGGYYYHHFLEQNGPGDFSNNWFPVAAPSSQALINGVYEIPLNLQANPGNEEVTFISRNEWFDHFSHVMTEQEGFVGHPYAVNNWRDTAKNLGNGNKILQHRSPLLKTMLIASDSTFDVLAALRYVEQEYTRYRFKFVQKIIEFRNNGTLTDNDDPVLWVQAVIEALRLNKSAEFPFVLSQAAGGQFFVPPTPAALGIAVNTQPAIIGGVLRCHDGAEVPAFGDFRDPIMLAFEQRIYESIPEQFKTEDRPVFDLARYVEGYWFKNDATGYSRTEMNAIMAPMFERWAQNQRLDYRTNTAYAPGDPFSWNYSSCTDRDNNPVVAGNYRGLYQHYFDTDRPHVCPWEMLGFSEEPIWWALEYGLAPYTNGNEKMWEDLRDGRIAQGPREGIDTRYARPTLLDFVPVDDEGNLIDPVTLGLVDSAPTHQNAIKPWKFGDGGTVETLWRASPGYAFSLAQAGFLMKPARFVEQCWDTLNIAKDASGQWIYLPTGNRPLNSMITVHGEFLADGSRYYGSGVQQWISDHMVSKGQNPALLGQAVRGLGVKLAHKVGGFTSGEAIRVLADNFGLVPADDVSIELYRSPSISEEVYSGVLIEWTGSGWRVIGYDVRTPSFTIDPGLTTGPKGVISLAPSVEPNFNVWSANVYYSTNTRVVHDNVYYEANKPHTSGIEFEGQYWKALGAIAPQAPRVTTYLLGTGDDVVVPYGTVFETYQEVADFLLGHERYLIRRGWVFDDLETDTNAVRDWSAATKEFLSWAQVTWEPGSFITLSPAAEGATFVAEHGMVLDTLNPINGAFGLVDRTGYPIDRRNVVVNRIDGQASLASKDSDLYGARLHVGEIEHVLFFSNKTIFGDIIYAPLFNLRQPRLRLIGNRSTDWTGRLDAPGYVLIDGEIVSNFDKAATDLQTMFDIEKADNAELRDHARHVIGYDSRSYFQSLVLSETEQFEFYQGMIHQKGAPGAFNKLMRSDYIEQSRDLRFFEEWAIKIDEYGSMGGRSRASFLLGTSSLRNDPQMIQFRNTGEPTTNAEWQELIDIGVNIDKKWVERPKNPMVTFPQHKTYAPPANSLPMSGYVRMNEVDVAVWDNDALPALLPTGGLALGKRIWIHNVIGTVDTADQPEWSFVPRGVSPELDIAEGWVDANGKIPSIAPYLVPSEDGSIVFRSKKCEAPFVTSRKFTSVVGKVYEAEFRVRKTVKETNGKTAILRPGFDGMDDGIIAPPTGENAAMGVKSGVGYVPRGFNPQVPNDGDWIDTTDWVLNQWYVIKLSWTPTRSYDYVRERIRINRADTGDLTFKNANYSNAVFEMEEPKITAQDAHGWQVMQVFNAAQDGLDNQIIRLDTKRENAAIADYMTRIVLSRPHGLTDAHIGSTIVIDGPTQTQTDLNGIQIIANAGANWIDVLADNSIGVDFATVSIPGPKVRILRSVRFRNEKLMKQHKTLKGVKDGDVVYLDGATANDPWRVYRRRRTRLGLVYWEAFRRQPYRVDASAVSSALVYDLKTKITTESISPEPLVLHHFDVLSPQNGIVVGRAEREIDFKLRHDPANYSDTGWGRAQVGRVWWDISRVRFLETETDYVVFGQSNEQRFEAEASYRAQNWGKIAQGSRVDVYEWTRQRLTPTEWMLAKAKSKDRSEYEGTPYGFVGLENTFDEDFGETFAQIPLDGEFISRFEWDEENGRDEMFYYYWMSGLTTKPKVDFRNLDIAAVRQIITTPLAQDLPWMAPILPNSMVVGGLSSYLDDNFDNDAEIKRSGTVIQVEIDEDPTNDGVVHDEWLLLRPNDERSIPPEWLWEKMRDSLVGFDNALNLVPAPPEIVVGEAPVTNAPVFEFPPYTLGAPENEPYFPNSEDDND